MKRLFTVKNIQSGKALCLPGKPKVVQYFESKQEAKKARDAANYGIHEEAMWPQFCVSTGPDHRHYTGA